MNEKEMEGINFETETGEAAADSVKPEAAVSAQEGKQEEGPAGPVKRGRGRPPKNQQPEKPESPGEDIEAAGPVDSMSDADSDSAEDPTGSDSGDRNLENARNQDFLLVNRGMQILTEFVKSQSQSQEKLIRAQTEFSNSVMDRMDQYRIHMSKLESEAAEKEKNRLRDSYLEAQKKADDYLEEIHQLRTQLDLSGRKTIKMGVKIDSLTAENESLRQKLRDMKEKLAAKSRAANGSESDIEGAEDETAMSETDESCNSSGDSPEKSAGERSSGFCGLKQRRRKKFLEKVYCDRRYSNAQIALIRKADKAGIPLEGLKELCDPDISISNMQVMFSYMKR